MSNFLKIRPVGAVRTDRRTDGQIYMTKLTVVFRNFANVSKNEPVIVLLGHRDPSVGVRCQAFRDSTAASSPNDNGPLVH
jgi:hypothetical protein